jgi:hypothetical protein
MQDDMLSFLYPESYQEDDYDELENNLHDDIQDALDCADYNENY